MPFQPAAQSDSWVDDLANAIAPELDAVVTIREQGAPGVRDPETDEVDGNVEGDAVITERAATSRNQSPGKEISSGEHWRTVSLYRWTILRETGDPVITDGMLLEVVDGGYNAAITGKTMRILEAWANGPIIIAVAKVE